MSKKEEKRDIDFEMKLIDKPVSVFCRCKTAQILEKEAMADGWDCTCDMLYKEDEEEVETRFLLKHIGLMLYPRKKEKTKS